MSTIRRITVIVLPLLLLQAGCMRDRTLSLKYGFKLVYLDGRNRALIDRQGDFVVYPNITRFDASGLKVTGMRERPPLGIDVEDPNFKSGFGPFCVQLKRDGSHKHCSDEPPPG